MILALIVMSCATAAALSAPKWNSVTGTWEGDKAAGTLEVPDPLWIFGYGSLCWRADFPYDESIVGRVHGWKRQFCQRSTDHRGTPDAPGLVATMVPDAELEALSLRDAADQPSVTCGLCYRVGKADVEAVLGNLDFREKGGYSRDIVEVHPAAGGTPVRALVYSATTSNPGFSAEAITDEAAAAKTIAAAHGPSGPNREYLVRMAQWLEEVGETDEHVAALMRELPPE